MTSADFCRFSMTLRPWLPLSGRSLQTSPGTTRFFPSTYLPHLPSLVPCSYGTSTCMAALSSAIAYMRFLFVRPEVCQPASFRFRLAADTLAFGYTFPTTGQIPDFHRLETCAAGRTTKKVPPALRDAGGTFGYKRRLAISKRILFMLFVKRSGSRSISAV